jgi:hypothetical protein
VTRLYVGSPMALVYSLGLDLTAVEKIFYVEISDLSRSLGSRDLRSNIKICEKISDALGKEFEFCSFDNNHKIIKNITDVDFLDFRIYLKNFAHFKKLRIKPVFICLTPEISGIHSPRLYKMNYGKFKLRLELLIRVFLKLKIYEFHSIGLKGRKGIFFKEKPIDWGLFFKKLEEIRTILQLNELNYFSKLSKLDRRKNLLVILPLAEHFGGSLEFNEKMFLALKESTYVTSIGQILLKNHPSDLRDYSEMVNNFFPDKLNVVTQSVEEVNVPIELLISDFNKISFAGAFSAAIYSFASKAEVPSLVFIPELQKKWINYLSGTAISEIQHNKFYI